LVTAQDDGNSEYMTRKSEEEYEAKSLALNITKPKYL
jgi:hypothetical protein